MQRVDGRRRRSALSQGTRSRAIRGGMPNTRKRSVPIALVVITSVRRATPDARERVPKVHRGSRPFSRSKCFPKRRGPRSGDRPPQAETGPPQAGRGPSSEDRPLKRGQAPSSGDSPKAGWAQSGMDGRRWRKRRGQGPKRDGRPKAGAPRWRARTQKRGPK